MIVVIVRVKVVLKVLGIRVEQREDRVLGDSLKVERERDKKLRN